MKRFELINGTGFKSEDIEEIASALLESQHTPTFYLVCMNAGQDGVTLTNLDKPIVLIYVDDLGQFAETFVHEIVHLQQHSQGYATEDFKSEVVVTGVKRRDGQNG